MKQSAKADFVLCHADRDMMKLRQEEYVVLPAAVLIEVLVAAALCMIGVLEEVAQNDCHAPIFSAVTLNLTFGICMHRAASADEWL